MPMQILESLTLIAAWAAGVALGAVFFGGLWWTIRKGLASPHAAFWFFGSMLLRTSVAVTGFYVVSGGQWQRLLACLLGFVTARLLVTWLTRPSAEARVSASKEASHAPDP